jgi:hypothetical protein
MPETSWPKPRTCDKCGETMVLPCGPLACVRPRPQSLVLGLGQAGRSVSMPAGYQGGAMRSNCAGTRG